MSHINGFVLIPVSMIHELRDIGNKIVCDAPYGNISTDEFKNIGLQLDRIVKICCDQLKD